MTNADEKMSVTSTDEETSVTNADWKMDWTALRRLRRFGGQCRQQEFVFALDKWRTRSAKEDQLTTDPTDSH